MSGRAGWQRTRVVGDRLWFSPPSGLDLGGCQVHVWRASLDVSESRLRDLCHTLSADERSRAERLAFARDRRRFVAARGMLRVILGRYLDADPGSLQFGYGQWGKPFLSLPFVDQSWPQFNLSHSDGLALYAIARQRVGIDLERIRSISEADDISKRFFSARENAAYGSLPVELRPKAFFVYWTRREAYLKALGVGLAASWDQSCGVPVDSVRAGLSPARWSLHDLRPGLEYVAALATEGGASQLEYWQFDPSCND